MTRTEDMERWVKACDSYSGGSLPRAGDYFGKPRKDVHEAPARIEPPTVSERNGEITVKLPSKGEVTFKKSFQGYLEARFFVTSRNYDSEKIEEEALPLARNYAKEHGMDVEIRSTIV